MEARVSNDFGNIDKSLNILLNSKCFFYCKTPSYDFILKNE